MRQLILLLAMAIVLSGCVGASINFKFGPDGLEINPKLTIDTTDIKEEITSWGQEEVE